jgi:AcrR family transcriptional regulator
MSRWQPGARERLQRAALELFAEQGFARTTVPDITARAGLTTRTFFRYFADKREVLFAGEDELPMLIEQVIRDAPASLSPLGLINHGIDEFAVSLFEGRRDLVRARRAVVDSDESLREREQRKLAMVAEAAERGLRARGIDELTAAVAAQLGVAAFRVAVLRWSADAGSGLSLAEVSAETLAAMRAVASA